MSTHTHQIISGLGGLPKVMLTAADGASAEIYLHGAHLTSWIPAGGAERLFLSRASEFRAGAAIRGGVPIVFPQFSNFGPLPRHGFVRNTAWELMGVETTAEGQLTVKFSLSDSEATRNVWPHAFQIIFAVTIGGQQLRMKLSITNSSEAPFIFSCALHTYLQIADIHQTVIENLQDVRYLDQVNERREAIQGESLLPFNARVDRVYFDAPARVVVHEPQRQLSVAAEGFPDVVTWNPGATLGATLPDLEPDGYRRMLCVEAAAIGRPITLAPGPGGQWHGTQTLTT